MFWVYVLRSDRNGRFYIGYAHDVEERLKQHNSGKVKSTKYRTPFRLVHKEAYATAEEAQRRERHIKDQKSRKYVEGLVESSSIS